MPTPSNRAGRYVQQATGYRAFVPEPLPPEPPIVFDGELQTWLSNADRDLARLDAIADVLPNPDLFVAMYVRHEAVLSSQIEGTQSTLEDVLAFETAATADDAPQDVEEVFNYVRAMNHGLRRLAEHFPLSLRLIREIHAELMHGGGRKIRGGEKTPGEFRRTQNWIGGAGCTLTTASFVPPPPHELMNALDGLEKFLHQGRHSLPLLVRCGLAHAQFETIHPFLDGNGRAGRLLLNLLLVRLGWPPAIIFKRSRDRYLDALDRADHGDDGPLAELIARSVLDNLQRLVVPNIAGPARLVPLQSLAGPAISYPALRQAATRGRLEAEIGSDGLWRSTQHAVDAYLADRHQRRPRREPRADG